MSVSPCELKQSAENVSITPLFDWENCLPKFKPRFEDAVFSRSNAVMLFGLRVTRDELPGIRAFLSAYPTVYFLDISDTPGLFSQGVLALIQDNTTLTTLWVAGSMRCFGSRYIDTHTRALRTLAHHTTLTSLDISDNLINDEDAVILAGSTTLKCLNLSHNHIMNKGAIALANNTNFESLNVTDNCIGAEGATALSRVTQNRVKILQDQQLALLMGMHSRVGAESSLFDFSNNRLYERKTLPKIFAFDEPTPFLLIPSDSEVMECAQINDEFYHRIQEAIRVQYAPDAKTQNEVLSIFLARFAITEDQYYNIHHRLNASFVRGAVRLNRGETDFDTEVAAMITEFDSYLTVLDEQDSLNLFNTVLRDAVEKDIMVRYAPDANTQNEALPIILTRFSITEDQYNGINDRLDTLFRSSAERLNRGGTDLEVEIAGIVTELDRALHAQQAEVEQRLARQRAEAEAVRVAVAARQVETCIRVEIPGERGTKISAICRREP